MEINYTYHFTIGTNQNQNQNIRSRRSELRRIHAEERSQMRTNQITRVILNKPTRRLFYFSDKVSVWLLIKCPDEFQQFFTQCKYGFCNAYNKLETEKTKKSPFAPSAIVIPGMNASMFTISAEKVAMIEAIMYENQKFRWQMKRLINKWFLNKLKEVNKDDIVTCEPPIKPVVIYDWNNRSKYVLEASTVYRDFREKIFNANGLITNTQLPKNPFINQTYSLGQLHFIIKSLECYRITDWALQGLQSQEYDLLKFKMIYRDAIGIEVLRRCFSNPTDYGCIDTVFDFITMEYNYHGLSTISDDIWYWFLENKPDWPLIQRWRKICFKFYSNPSIGYDLFNHSETYSLVKMRLTDMVAIYRAAL